MKKIMGILGLIVVLFLVGCVVPNQYKSTAHISKDKVKFNFDGHFVDSEIVRPFKAGKINEEKAKEMTLKVMKDLSDSYKKNGVPVATAYANPGEFTATFHYTVSLDPNERHEVIGLLGFKRIGANKVIVNSMDVSKSDFVQELTKDGIQCKGDIVITIDQDGKVLEQNAQDTPGLISNSYVWHLSWQDAPVHFVVQF